MVAGAAFLIIFISGIMAGISVGAVVLRAIVFSMLVGAGAAGIEHVVRRYLPELMAIGEKIGTENALDVEEENDDDTLFDEVFTPDYLDDASLQESNEPAPEEASVVDMDDPEAVAQVVRRLLKQDEE